jgi:NodT family efflux transporter outer membrane factor (OMF) lipoprotein
MTTTPSVNRSHVSATQFGVATNTTFTQYQLPFDASWQPDFWGKVRNSVSAASFAAQASAADLENVKLTVHAELAVDYYQLRAQDALIVLLDSAAAVERQALEYNRALFKGGLASGQAVAQSESLLESAEADAANARIARAQYEHAIAVLLGRSASSFSLAAAPFRPPSAAIPPGLPSELLERRPDVAAAERSAAQANALIGVARAAYYPVITLSAAGGFSSFSPSQLFTAPAGFWNLGVSAGELLLDGGLRKATVRQYQAQFDQAAAQYRQTVLAAFQQVEDDLASVRISSTDIQRQQAAVDAADRNLEESKARFGGGIGTGLELTSAQTSLLELEQTALAYRLQLAVAEVRLIEALGGGWDASKLPKASALR